MIELNRIALMSQLHVAAKQHGLTEIEAMNILQNHGNVVSDLCIFFHDIPTSDLSNAAAFLANVPRDSES